MCERERERERKRKKENCLVQFDRGGEEFSFIFHLSVSVVYHMFYLGWDRFISVHIRSDQIRSDRFSLKLLDYLVYAAALPTPCANAQSTPGLTLLR